MGQDDLKEIILNCKEKPRPPMEYEKIMNRVHEDQKMTPSRWSAWGLAIAAAAVILLSVQTFNSNESEETVVESSSTYVYVYDGSYTQEEGVEDYLLLAEEL